MFPHTSLLVREHDPEKWIPAFRKDHAQTRSWSAMTLHPEIIAL